MNGGGGRNGRAVDTLDECLSQVKKIQQHKGHILLAASNDPCSVIFQCGGGLIEPTDF